MPNWPISSSEAASFLAVAQFLPQLGGPRPGQRADQVHHLGAGHPDAVVTDGQGPGVLVHGDLDGQIRGVDVKVLVAERFEPDLVQRVRCIRDQLPQKGILVGVHRMDHQIQQLAGLRLKLQLLDLRTHMIPFANRWVFVVSILERLKMVAALTGCDLTRESHTCNSSPVWTTPGDNQGPFGAPLVAVIYSRGKCATSPRRAGLPAG